MSLDADSENLLENALSQAFSPTHSRTQSAIVLGQQYKDIPPSNPSAPAISAESPSILEESSTLEISQDDWKSEYESQVESWRAQSADAREKAEKERARWEAIRATQPEDLRWHSLTPADQPTESEWQQIRQTPSLSAISSLEVSESIPASPSPVDARGLVSGEQEKYNSHPPPTSHTRQNTGDESQKWEHVPSSVESSFPSMTFPEETPSPPHEMHATQEPLSATLSIFDSSLSTRTRVTAVVSSLAINLLLPFINGVMLGFGEIFAKNVVLRWLGWSQPPAPGSTAGLRGLGTQRRRRDI